MMDLLKVLIGCFNQAISFVVVGLSPFLLLISAIVIAVNTASGKLDSLWLISVIIILFCSTFLSGFVCSQMIQDSEIMDEEEKDHWKRLVRFGTIFIYPIVMVRYLLEIEFPEDYSFLD